MWNTDISSQKLRIGNDEFSSDNLSFIKAKYLSEHDEALRELYLFLLEWFDTSSSFVRVQTSGSTGTPKQMLASKQKMMNSAVMTCSFLGLKKGYTALLCMNIKYIGAKMVVVRALVAGMNIVVRKASSHPFADITEKIDFAAIVPLQLRSTMEVMHEKTLLSACSCVIVGGGAVEDDLCSMLKDLNCEVYSTYGMTETLSHIALRSLNGSKMSSGYIPFHGVDISLSENGTLVIKAPLLFDGVLKTNDVADIRDDGSFIIKGRIDNIINSGGIKIQIESVEKQISGLIDTPFAVTSVPHKLLGEALVLLVDKTFVLPDGLSGDEFIKKLSESLPKYHAPKELIILDEIPTAGNGKTDRRLCRIKAAEISRK